MLRKMKIHKLGVALVTAGVLTVGSIGASAASQTFSLATSASETDMRSVAMREVFAPMVSGFADFKAGYSGSLFAQGTELEAISRGNVTMSIASAQELAQFFPEFSIFATGYVHQDAAHQVRVFNDPLMLSLIHI